MFLEHSKSHFALKVKCHLFAFYSLIRIMNPDFLTNRNYEPTTAKGRVIEAINHPHPADDFHLVHINELDDFGSSVLCEAFKSDDWDERKINYLDDEEVLYCGDKLLPWSMQPDELKEGFANFIKRSEIRELRISRRERLLELFPIPLPIGLRSRFLYSY